MAIFAVPTNMINRLVHVAFVFKAGATTAFFNGRSLGTQSVGLGAGLGRPFQIGASGPANQEAWPGRIDEVAIYSDALGSNAVAAHYAAFLAQPNGLLREVYDDIPGVTVEDLTQSPGFPDSPSSESLINDWFEAPSDVADRYGQRLRAWLIPPATGDYTFWIAADDAARLLLSTDDTPDRKRLIASVQTATDPREWTKDPSQQSVSISLTNGRRYYIEALMKEGAGHDHLSVRWQLPGGVMEEPIPATRTTPFGLTAPMVTSQSLDVTVDEGGLATFQVQVTPPAVLTVARLGDAQTITIFFSEPVEAATATNLTSYSIDHGVTILGATFDRDTSSVTLSTTPLSSHTTYTLLVRDVRDRALNPNTIPPNSPHIFSIDPVPAEIAYLRPPAEPIGPSSRRSPFVISEIMYHPLRRPD